MDKSVPLQEKDFALASAAEKDTQAARLVHRPETHPVQLVRTVVGAVKNTWLGLENVK